LRASGLAPNKKSFLNLEINFYLIDKTLDFKSTILRESLKDLTKKIITENFSRNPYFSFTLTKNCKVGDND
jgi:hypothetical protein